MWVVGCLADPAHNEVFKCPAVGLSWNDGQSSASLECHKDGNATVTVHSLSTIDRVEFQLGSLDSNKKFIPFSNPKSRCVAPASAGSPCSANWKRKDPLTVGGGDAGGQLLQVNVDDGPVPGINQEIYNRRRRAANNGNNERVSSFTFDHDADPSSNVDVNQDMHGSYVQSIHIQIRELFVTDNSQLLSVLDSPIISLKCINHLVQPKDKNITIPPWENENVVVCKTDTFNVVAIRESYLVPETIRVTITRDLALVDDTQQTWVVNSLNYSSDPVISNNDPSDLAAVIGAKVKKPTPNDDSFVVVTDYVVLENADSLPIRANVGFRAAKDVLESDSIQICDK
ncbi:hypothetical protein BV898_03300 [Hypsibius exemplaris]|uniref:Uncharacterized protein n=1 Tax=Hypsibius exemplaris TaxID=2072580 RepID=A0A1W0X633_HYPEX|nr:hypothetical protein BV898_03300 [Hypsibius exemplaris]